MNGPRYDPVADFYEHGWPDRYDDPPSSAMLSLSGDLKQTRVLDLACGHGRITRELARRGASVIGLDLSPRLIEKARREEERLPLGVRYLCAAAAGSERLVEHRVDVVICAFGLSDIDDLGGRCGP